MAAVSGGAGESASAEPNRWAVLALLSVAQLMVVLDATIVTIAIPSAQKALGFSTESRQWIVTAYALAFGSLLLLGGKLGDLFGRKWTLIAGLVGFSVASAIGGLAAILRRTRRRAHAPGCVRRAACALGAVPAHGDIRGIAGPANGVRNLRRDRRRRRLTRPDTRRRTDAGPVLALVPVRQPRDRRSDDDRRAAPARQSRCSTPGSDRHPRGSHLGVGTVRAGLWILQRRDPLLGGDGDDRGARRQPRAADRLRADRAPGQVSAAADPHHLGPDSRRGVHDDRTGGRRHLRRVSVSHLLPAGATRPLAADHGAGVPAADRGSRGHVDHRPDPGDPAHRGQAAGARRHDARARSGCSCSPV